MRNFLQYSPCTAAIEGAEVELTVAQVIDYSSGLYIIQMVKNDFKWS